MDALLSQLERIAADLGASADGMTLERPRNPEHGDLASNLALILAKSLGQPPRAVAETILSRLDLRAAGVASAEIAGPGFINFRLASAHLRTLLAGILAADQRYGRSDHGRGRRVQVEFVSANPTGPLHIAHGRGAALGDAIAALLEWTGHEVSREFYVNDAGVQMDRLGESLDARWRQLRGEPAGIPEGGYHGEYLIEMARVLVAERGAGLAAMDAAERVAFFRDWAATRLREEQDADLREFGVRFDEYVLETSLYRDGRLEETLADLAARGLSYQADGAVWMATSRYGDDKDRVLVKSDGTYTYFLPDIAYHREKAKRGYDHVIDVWGADHHGYAPRMKAALGALGLPGLLDVEIVQMVRIMRGGEEARLSKRAGQYITLRELIDEVGVDVARYFFLMRRGDAQMLFDLDLALDHTEKNPVFKIQYAHARMASIFRKAGVAPGGIVAEGVALERLEHSAELELVKQLSRLPETVERAAAARGPHMICEYLESTAGEVNSWYHAGNPSRNPELAVLVGDPELRAARLVLARAVQIVLRNGLALLGIGAPDRMTREDSE
ncbi:MAG: arginine--tRNA ligase [Gemmatimonadetes bacterium]|nr:arginine--tRNA ligase [Gemmatimonadota bacterium]